MSEQEHPPLHRYTCDECGELIRVVSQPGWDGLGGGPYLKCDCDHEDGSARVIRQLGGLQWPSEWTVEDEPFESV